MFGSYHYWFLVFGHFWQWCYENMKILYNICLHFARQGRQEGKNRKENRATKVTKIQKTKRRKYGMNKTKFLSYSIHSEKVLRNHIIMEVQIWYEYAFRNGFTPLCKYYTAICSSYLENWIEVVGLTVATRKSQKLKWAQQ